MVKKKNQRDIFPPYAQAVYLHLEQGGTIEFPAERMLVPQFKIKNIEECL